MRQEINLYQDVLLEKPEPLQSRQVGIFLLLLLVGLAIAGYMNFHEAQTAQLQADQLRQKQQTMTMQISELEAKYPPHKPNQLLVEKISRLEQEIAGQRKALDYFNNQDTGSNETVLASLYGLARYPQKGVWLRRVTFLHNGHDIRLAGSAIKPELIPDYLKTLGEKNIFGGQVFSRLALNRLQERGDIIDFELDSSRGTK